jgi:hypothetical protein
MAASSPAFRRDRQEYLGFTISIEVASKEELLALRADIHEDWEFKGRVALAGPISDEAALVDKLARKARHFIVGLVCHGVFARPTGK